MAITPYTTMVNEVQLEVLKAPFPLITRALRNAAIDFYTRSEAMVYTHDKLTLITGVNTYSLDPADETRIGKILTARYKGAKLKPTSRELLNQQNSGWDVNTGSPALYFSERPNEVIFAPVPNATEALAVSLTASLIPTRSSTGVEEVFFEEHYAAINHGALMLLFMMGHQEWADSGRAQAESFAFGDAISMAKAKAQQDNTAKSRTMSYGGL